MKVVHVINSLGGSGGAEHGLVRESTRFSSDVDQMVVRLFSKDQLDFELEQSNIPVIGLGLKAESAARTWPLAAKKVSQIIASETPDVVHSSLFAGNLTAQLAGRARRIPVLSTFTLSGDSALLRRYQPGAASWKASALRGIAGVAARGRRVWFRALTWDSMVTNTTLLHVERARATVIPRGVPDLMPESPMSREELGLPTSGLLLVNVGRQTAQKGQLSLLEALKEILDQTPAHLVIVGREGDASASIKERIEAMSLGSHVTLTGYTPLVHHYVLNATVFVFSSMMEGLGTAVVEALSLGKKVVAFDIPPIREVTKDGELARLVEAGNSSALAAAVLEAAMDSDSGAMSRRSEVLDRFSIDSVARRVEELLRDVARR